MNKNLLKSIILITVSLILSLFIVGCVGKGQPAPSSEEETTSVFEESGETSEESTSVSEEESVEHGKDGTQSSNDDSKYHVGEMPIE